MNSEWIVVWGCGILIFMILFCNFILPCPPVKKYLKIILQLISEIIVPILKLISRILVPILQLMFGIICIIIIIGVPVGVLFLIIKLIKFLWVHA